jgi:hypothetical protein
LNLKLTQVTGFTHPVRVFNVALAYHLLAPRALQGEIAGGIFVDVSAPHQ